ncbi:AmmeMemoRadiSam system protein A [Clostridium sp.]|jgi:MEMO1 family protein|uniref:AmmeMemoRadiSam system protein A n=1 Tax=Clostridium sp. TaxID=1506 RepID=UPI0039F4A398
MGKIVGHYIMPHPPIIIKEVGKGEENKAINTVNACNKIGEEISKFRPDTIIVITPHGPLFRDALSISILPKVSGDLGNFNAPEIKFNIDVDLKLSRKIRDKAYREGIITVPIDEKASMQYGISLELDHGSMVPLYFINNYYVNYQIVHITYGLLSKEELYRFGMIIKESVEESNTTAVVIASGDLSHRLNNESPYGAGEHGETFDKKSMELLQNGDILGLFSLDRKIIKDAGECGLRSFYILSGTMDGCDVKGELLSYEGPFGIGYGVMKFYTRECEERKFLNKISDMKKKEMKRIRECEDIYAKLARSSLEHYVKTGEYIDVPVLYEKMLTERNGVFVSIKKDGELRGCIGTIFPTTDCIAKEIIKNAVEAGQRDPRFSPVEEEELPYLEYSVDILMPPTKAVKEELDPKKYGVIVRKGSKTGILLPDLDGVDTVEEQISIALDKANIDKNEDYEIEKFEVIRKGSKC